MKQNKEILPQRRGLCLVIAAPSGAGKSTLCQKLLSSDADLIPSVSATTRPPRPGEKDGVEYHFYSLADFERLLEENGLIEWAKVYGNYYGTPRKLLEEALAAGKDVLLDLDWQGFRNMKKLFPKDSVGIFLLPPSLETLEERLRRRSSDSEEVIAARMAQADAEMSHWQEFDYVIVNDDLEKAAEEATAILNASRRAVIRYWKE